MGGFFGSVSKRDCVTDVFFGVDYHSHLGTFRGGMAAFSEEEGFQRYIHNIENTPFRTKFEDDLAAMSGNACIGCISDTDPQPVLIASHHGMYAICTVGLVRNAKALVDKYISAGYGHFAALSGGRIGQTELIASLIDSQETFVQGIQLAQELVEGSISILILNDKGELIAARDRMGRLPVLVGQDESGYSVSFESFAYQKLGYHDYYELGPGEIVCLRAEGMEQMAKPRKEMRICAFLWTYYGYPNSVYEGVNVEVMRNRNGAIMAKRDRKAGIAQDVDYICGVPDSGIPHAIGYANESHIPFARPFIKYTPTWPRSFMPKDQRIREHVAKMKQIPVHDLIADKKLLLVDDSIVRGTQLRETVDFLYENGAKEVHMRSACPPIMFGCKYLNFSRSKSEMELLARQTINTLEGKAGLDHLDEYGDGHTARGKEMRCEICKKMKFDSLEYQSLQGMLDSIGLEPCKVCTYCWNGKE